MKFIATDGTIFTKRCEYRRYEMETQYTFRNRESTTLIKPIGSISGQPFVIANCTNTTILILDHCDQVQIDDTSFCKIFIAACSESVFLRDCSNCSLKVGCKQFRTRNCKDCDIYLYCTTEPIIENSTGMRFAPFHPAVCTSFEGHLDVMKKARLLLLDDDNGKEEDNDDVMLMAKKQNQWQKVYDFTPPILTTTTAEGNGTAITATTTTTSVLLPREGQQDQHDQHPKVTPPRNWDIIQNEEQQDDDSWFISNPLQVEVRTAPSTPQTTSSMPQTTTSSASASAPTAPKTTTATTTTTTSTNKAITRNNCSPSATTATDTNILASNKTGTCPSGWCVGSLMKLKTQLVLAPRSTIHWIFSTVLIIFKKIVLSLTGNEP